MDGAAPRVAVRADLDRIPQYVAGLSAQDAPGRDPGAEAVKLSANENPLGPSPLAVEAIARAAWEVHRYPDPSCRTLRRALSARLGIAPERIVVANGGDNLITLIAQTLIEPGTPVAIPEVTFASYEIAARIARAEVRRVPMDGWAVDAAKLAGELRRGARLAFVANPNNPTGTLLSADDLRRVVDAVPDGGVLVLDEAYIEFVDDEPVLDGAELVRQGAPVVALRTFSKAYGLAGLRVGYALAPGSVAAALWRVREAFATNRLAEAAAVAALGDEEHLRRTKETVRAGRQQLYRLLREAGLEFVPSQANFVWVRTGVPGEQMMAELARRGVLVRPGDFWGHPLWIRVTVGTPAQNERWVRALQEVLGQPGAAGAEAAARARPEPAG